MHPLRDQVIKEIRRRRLIFIFTICLSFLYLMFSVSKEVLLYYDLKQKMGSMDTYFNKELKELENFNEKVNNLKEYISYKKTLIKNHGELLLRYQTEINRLEPILKADSTAINTALILQNEKLASDKWTDRLIGFIIGIMTSIIGSIIFDIFQRKKGNIG